MNFIRFKITWITFIPQTQDNPKGSESVKQWSGADVMPYIKTNTYIIEPPRGKTNNVVSEHARQKPNCLVTEKS